MGMFGSIVKQVLTEDKISDYIKKLISNNTDDFFKQYLKTKVADLPENLQEHFKQAAEHSYNACIEHDLNLTQLFRLEFLNFFDLSHGKGPQKYIAGIARIAIEQLGMFYAEHDHSKISKLKAMAIFINEHPDLVPEYDGNFNGIKYMQLEDQVYPILKEYNLKNRQNLSDFETKTDYEIVPIKNFEQSSQYGKYTSWCVTHEKQHFNSYTNNGQKFYFCLKEGFEDVPRVAGNNAPLDEYGLSMISVQVNTDGEPEHITTRWNHDYNGENNPGLKTPKQVQEVVGVNFYDTFKPWTDEELEKLRENGDYEEDIEARREQYDQQRWEAGVYLWDDCCLMCSYDDDFEFDPNDEDYYVYDTLSNDYDPISYECVKKEPVYLSSDNKIAVLKDAYRSDEYAIAVAYEDGTRNGSIELITGITYYDVFELQNDVLIPFIQKADKGASKFGYVSYGDFASTSNNFDFGMLDKDVDEHKLFINKYVNEYIADYQVAVELEHADGKHSLFIVTPGGNDIITVVKSDIPTNSVMFMYDENEDVVLGSVANYTLEGKVAYANFDYSGGKILSIEKNLNNKYFVVSVESNDANMYNLIKKGETRKLIPFDFATYKFQNEMNIFIPKKRIGKGNFEYESYLFDLNQEKIVSRKHCDFSLSDGTFYGGDCADDDIRNAVFYVINRNNYMEEEGPFKRIDAQKCNKVILKAEDGYCYIFDTLNFKFLKKVKNYGIVNKYDNDNPMIVALQSPNDEIYLYRYDTLEIIDNKPLLLGYNPRCERGYLFVKHADNGCNLINLSTMEPLFAEDVQDLRHEPGKGFVGAFNDNFFYFYDLVNGEFYPTKYGIDLRNAIEPFFDKSWGRLTFAIKLNGVDYVVRCDSLSASRGFNIEVTQVSFDNGSRTYDGWKPLKNADANLQNVVKDMLYPQQRVQVANSFNEMLNRMNRTRNGSIIL